MQILSGGNSGGKRWELRKYRKDFLSSFCVEFREGDEEDDNDEEKDGYWKWVQVWEVAA